MLWAYTLPKWRQIAVSYRVSKLPENVMPRPHLSFCPLQRCMSMQGGGSCWNGHRPSIPSPPVTTVIAAFRVGTENKRGKRQMVAAECRALLAKPFWAKEHPFWMGMKMLSSEHNSSVRASGTHHKAEQKSKKQYILDKQYCRGRNNIYCRLFINKIPSSWPGTCSLLPGLLHRGRTTTFPGIAAIAWSILVSRQNHWCLMSLQ